MKKEFDLVFILPEIITPFDSGKLSLSSILMKSTADAKKSSIVSLNFDQFEYSDLLDSGIHYNNFFSFFGHKLGYENSEFKVFDISSFKLADSDRLVRIFNKILILREDNSKQFEFIFDENKNILDRVNSFDIFGKLDEIAFFNDKGYQVARSSNAKVHTKIQFLENNKKTKLELKLQKEHITESEILNYISTDLFFLDQKTEWVKNLLQHMIPKKIMITLTEQNILLLHNLIKFGINMDLIIVIDYAYVNSIKLNFILKEVIMYASQFILDGKKSETFLYRVFSYFDLDQVTGKIHYPIKTDVIQGRFLKYRSDNIGINLENIEEFSETQVSLLIQEINSAIKENNNLIINFYKLSGSLETKKVKEFFEHFKLIENQPNGQQNNIKFIDFVDEGSIYQFFSTLKINISLHNSYEAFQYLSTINGTVQFTNNTFEFLHFGKNSVEIENVFEGIKYINEVLSDLSRLNRSILEANKVRNIDTIKSLLN